MSHKPAGPLLHEAERPPSLSEGLTGASVLWYLISFTEEGETGWWGEKLTGVVVDIVRSDDGVVRLLPANRQLIPDAVGERQRLRLPEKQKNRKQSQSTESSSSLLIIRAATDQDAKEGTDSPVYTSFTCFCVGRSMFKIESIKAVYLETRPNQTQTFKPCWMNPLKHCFYAHSLSVWKLLQQQEEEEGDRRKAGCVGGLSLSLITIGGNRPATFHRRWWCIAWRFPGQPLDLKAPWLTLNIKNPTWTHNNHVTVSYSPLHSPAVHELISGHQPEESWDFFIKCPLKTHFIFYITPTRHL